MVYDIEFEILSQRKKLNKNLGNIPLIINKNEY